MKVLLEKNRCTVTREPGDARISGGNRNAAGESKLLYAVKNVLNAQGRDIIKKRMAKDGHMVDDMQQYIRDRDFFRREDAICIYNPRWATNGADETYNRDGVVVLMVTAGGGAI